ncbi:MAG: ABC transporter substrate-binding protein [Gammaproteobacteria bacterium]
MSRILSAVVLTILLQPVYANETAIDTANADAAKTIVDELHNALLEIMRNGASLGYNGRYEIIKPIIAESFDTPIISQVIMGRYWDDLDADKQQEFMALFRELSTATYANRFSEYADESFQHVSVDSLNKGRLLVRTELIKAGGEKVKFDYLMHQRDSDWYIISVVAQGVNDLSMKRAEYNSVIQSSGFDALFQTLQDKIAEMETTADL